MSCRLTTGVFVLLLAFGAEASFAEIYASQSGGLGRITVHSNSAAGNATCP